jgi:hypothetical protein
MYALSIILAVMMRYYGADEINLKVWKINCEPNAEGSGTEDKYSEDWSLESLTPDQYQYYAACKGNAAVYRVSFMTSAFFVLMILACCCENSFHTGLWGWKWLIWVVLMGTGFFLPNYVFDDTGFAWAARVFSAIFLLLQILILIEFGYNWNASWVKKAEEGDTAGTGGKKWLLGILAGCFICYVFWFGTVVALYVAFEDCSLDKFFISVTLLAVIFFTVLQLTGEEGALLPSAVVAAYCAFLNWSACSSNPDPCNPAMRDTENGWLITIGIVFTTFSLCWTSLSTADSLPSITEGSAEQRAKREAEKEKLGGARSGLPPSSLGGRDPIPGPSSTQMTQYSRGPTSTDDDTVDSDDVRVEVNDDVPEKEEAYWQFHMVMLFGSMYISMLLTDWGSDPAGAGSKAMPSGGKTGMWMKIICEWITIAIYTWTLIAPRCCPKRQFN